MNALPFEIAGLEDLAGDKVFARGQHYFVTNRVNPISMTTERAIATVSGSDLYQTRLSFNQGDLEVDCSCPHAEEGFFCKHGVALGLLWLNHPNLGDEEDQYLVVRQWLEQQPHSGLVDLLMGLAFKNDLLFRELSSASHVGKPHSVSDLHRFIDAMVEQDAYHDWISEAKLAADIPHLVQMLRDQLTTNVQAVPELCEYAISCMIPALEVVAQTNDEIEEGLAALEHVHRQACQIIGPAPLDLAERLLELELSSGMYAFQDSVDTYADVLGAEGQRHFRFLLQQRWDRLTAITQRNDNDDDDGHRWHLKEILKKQARQAGDIDALISIVAKDLSALPYYLELAELHQQAGNAGEAIQWAEDGLARFPGQHTTKLEDFLIQRYVEQDRGSDALDLAWKQFVKHASLPGYRQLHGIANTLGDWPAQRSKTLDWLTQRPRDRYDKKPLRDQSLRVEIALWEDDLAGAWDAFGAGECRHELALKLAKALEVSTPQRAIAIYQGAVEYWVEQTTNRAYEEAMQLVVGLSSLMPAVNFQKLCESLHRRYKAKRNFIKLLVAFRPPE